MVMGVINVMEKVVRDVLVQYKDELHLPCKCNRCMDDVLAITLNKLPPRYIVNKEHSPYIRALHEADKHGSMQILMAVARASTLVAKSPRCGSPTALAMQEENEQSSSLSF